MDLVIIVLRSGIMSTEALCDVENVLNPLALKMYQKI